MNRILSWLGAFFIMIFLAVKKFSFEFPFDFI